MLPTPILIEIILLIGVSGWIYVKTNATIMNVISFYAVLIGTILISASVLGFFGTLTTFSIGLGLILSKGVTELIST
ncbi:hypothetical protein AKJ53_01505 [candidate division MSBL1 archaeon SCGC-AAA382F02]|uniref:Uncharacterized protein n=1 Tax=candidate division MSBL1 archaeon SCGC-AAA382F02 TaxID=1698282 RepID=A0A133VHW5_9EURY|nr:hypothetical protein AKJ53_01505 [candidate division MSBL1 archaeon SCGC-AAA382F02]